MKVTAASYADLASRLREAEKVIEEDKHAAGKLRRQRDALLARLKRFQCPCGLDLCAADAELVARIEREDP